MHCATNSWIILDRDGVINHDSDDYIKSPDEWELIEGSGLAIAKLNKLGFKVAVITNQSGIARGYFSLSTLGSIHQKLLDYIENQGGQIDAVYFCPHGPGDNCECRKPLAGMFKDLAEQHVVDLSNCYAIGDSIRDLEAGHSVNCKPILLKTGKGERSIETIKTKLSGHWLHDVPVYDDLLAFSDEIAKTVEEK